MVLKFNIVYCMVTQSVLGFVLYLLLAYYFVPGAFFSQFITAGLIYRSFGILFLAFVDHFQSDPAVTAWVGSLQIVVTLMGCTYKVTNINI